MNSINISKTRKYWIAVGFGSYVLNMLIFAAIYNILFRGNASNFSFNSNVQNTQVALVKSSATYELKKLRLQLDAYKQLKLALDEQVDISGISAIEKPFIINKDGYRFVFTTISVETRSRWGGSPSRYYILTVTIHNNNQKIDFDTIDIYYYHIFKSSKEIIQDHVANSIKNRQLYINKTQNIFLSLESSNPKAWGFWDFFYFSVVTQVTLGYGDILPNSFSIRMLVSMQIILGLSIPVVVFSLLLATDNE